MVVPFGLFQLSVTWPSPATALRPVGLAGGGNFTVIGKMKELALNHLPPFDKVSDKGFKDAYIYFTVLEYIKNCGDETMFFWTKGHRLREAFAKQDRVRVVKDFEEFEKHTTTYFKEKYFISKLKQEVAENISRDCIKNIWLNIEENWVIEISCEHKTSFVEVDFASREINDFTDFDFARGIQSLVISDSFASTHCYIDKIRDYVKYFLDKQIEDLIEASTENSQIIWIAEDEDVREFFLKLYTARKSRTSEETREVFERYFKVF